MTAAWRPGHQTPKEPARLPAGYRSQAWSPTREGRRERGRPTARAPRRADRRPRRLVGRAHPPPRALARRSTAASASRPPARRQGRPRPPQPDAARGRRRDPRRVLRGRARTSRRRTRSRRRRSGRPTTALEALAAEMSLEGARLARAAADDWTARTPERPRFVAGSVGPLNVTLSLSPKVDDAGVPRRHVRPGARRRTRSRSRRSRRRRRPAPDRDDLRHAEREGGDRRRRATSRRSCRSGSRSRRSTGAGATSPGRPSEAFWISVEHAEPLIVGVNCSLGATRDAAVPRGPRARRVDVRRPATRTPACRTRSGVHDEQPGDTSRFLRAFAEDGLVNVVGGCCGTTPEHIARDRARRRGPAAAPRPERASRGRASAASSRS